MATLLIAANLPDLDGLLTFSADARFHHRRGLTHGVLALVVLPLLLALGILAYDRLVRSRRGHAPVRAPELFVLSGVGVLSHLLLDWLNIYGVRLLMPFDDHWFYGDVLYIVDPWFWLILASGVAILVAPFVLGVAADAAGVSAAWLLIPALSVAALALSVPVSRARSG